MFKFPKKLWSFIFNPIPRKIKRIDALSPSESEGFFLSGRFSRIKELLKVVRIAVEFVRAFRVFHFLPPAVTIFGSARFKEGSKHYDVARKTGALLAKEGFAVITGAGPGLMEASNRGAQEAGGLSVGANIILPFEAAHNQYLDKVVTFYYFFVRKVILIKYSYAYIIMPGGFGTMDEMFEAITLIQTGKLYDFPVILVGKDYWGGLLDWIRKVLVTEGAIKESDLGYMYLTDSPEEVLEVIRKFEHKLKIPVQRM